MCFEPAVKRKLGYRRSIKPTCSDAYKIGHCCVIAGWKLLLARAKMTGQVVSELILRLLS